MVDFTPRRADSIRAALINHVAENRRPRRRRALWAAGLVLAGALAGAGASAAALAPAGLFAPADVQPRVPNYGPGPEYVLELQAVGADVDEPKDPHGTLTMLGLSPGELRQYENYRGLSIWSGESRHGTACLLVAHPVQGLLEGIGDARCSPEGLDTIADLTLCSGCSAPDVFDGLPTGSLIRFVLKGDHVDVYVYVRAAYPISSSG
ncbi:MULTISPECIES: hypothetical protein [unclassified Microbacterium]|uniref:hypothetical protein n=1 Tax=unclassified Microbacterium TaxID=2609290 RepID=UPI00214B0477|nr:MULTISPECIES: hypothetical protein [unclassified Microbacterium]MCR2784008.1 hypothetical protein [Microbacterium sp. zg.B96]WIM15150.1 hypothetical protein QNO11_11420 [Microbacterium sp. zg-B96]